MSLNATSAPRAVPLAAVAVLVLVVGGLATAGTAAYFELKPTASVPRSAGGGTTHLPPVNNTTRPSVYRPPLDVNVTDDYGRSVEVPFDPTRVAVLGPSIMDVMALLGLRSHVVAVDCYAAAFGGLTEDYSPDQVSAWNLTSAMCVQTEPTFAAEMLVNASPQLVLATTIVSVAAVDEITNSLHLPVVMVQAPTLSGILVDDTMLGQIFNVSSAATAINGELSREMYNVTNATGALFELPSVLVTFDTDANGYWTYGPGTFGLSLIELAGGTSISANASTAYPELAPATVLWDDPTDIVYGVGYGLNESTYASGPDWEEFGAVAAGNLSGINSNWITEPDPTMILQGLPALFALLHPEDT